MSDCEGNKKREARNYNPWQLAYLRKLLQFPQDKKENSGIGAKKEKKEAAMQFQQSNNFLR